MLTVANCIVRYMESYRSIMQYALEPTCVHLSSLAMSLKA